MLSGKWFRRMNRSLGSIRRRHATVLRVGALVIVAALLLPAVAVPQACETPVSVVPPSPDSQTPVTLTFLGYIPACSTLTYLVAGDQVRLEHVWTCVTTVTYAQRELSIGTLPAGTYEVRFVRQLDDPSEFIACGAFTVAAAEGGAPIPTLTPSSLILLMVIVAIIGVVATRRVG